MLPCLTYRVIRWRDRGLHTLHDLQGDRADWFEELHSVCMPHAICWVTIDHQDLVSYLHKQHNHLSTWHQKQTGNLLTLLISTKSFVKDGLITRTTKEGNPSCSTPVNLHEAFLSEQLAHQGWDWRWRWECPREDCQAPLPHWSPVTHSSRVLAALSSNGWHPHSDLFTKT